MERVREISKWRGWKEWERFWEILGKPNCGKPKKTEENFRAVKGNFKVYCGGSTRRYNSKKAPQKYVPIAMVISTLLQLTYCDGFIYRCYNLYKKWYIYCGGFQEFHYIYVNTTYTHILRHIVAFFAPAAKIN